MGVVRPLTGERVVGPCALPLTVAVGVENKLATGIDGSLIGFKTLTGREFEFNRLDGDPSLVGVGSLVILQEHRSSDGFVRVEAAHVERQLEVLTVAEVVALLPEVLLAQLVLDGSRSTEVVQEERRFNVDFTGLRSREDLTGEGDGVVDELGAVQVGVVPLHVRLLVAKSIGDDDEVHAVLLGELACAVVDDQFNADLVLGGARGINGHVLELVGPLAAARCGLRERVSVKVERVVAVRGVKQHLPLVGFNAVSIESVFVG